MGDIADYYLELEWDPEYDFETEVCPFDCDIELQRHQDASNGIRCNHCGMDNLKWAKTPKGNWRLYYGPHVHYCKEYKEKRV